MEMLKQSQKSIQLFMILFLAGVIYLDVLLVTQLYNSQQDQSRNLQPSFEVIELNYEDANDSVKVFKSEETLLPSLAKQEAVEDPSFVFVKGIDKKVENSIDANKEKKNKVETPSLSIIPYIDIQSLRYSPLYTIPTETDSYYDDVTDLCEKNRKSRVLLTDLFSFRSWWMKQSNHHRSRFNKYIKNGCISFNLGVWSLPDISLLRYNDLIDMITTGTQWIYSHFNVIVTTGIVMGGYEYPRGILTVLERAGIELLLVYHTSSNVYIPPPNSSPFSRYYGHGGLSVEGEAFLPESTNFYQFSANHAKSSVFETMQVVHVFGEETRLLNNLVHTGCTTDSRSKETLQVWYDEVIRWMLTQCSTQHPNNQHIVILFNLLSNQCSNVKKAYEQLQRIQEYLNTHSKEIFEFTTLISSISDYSQILANHHKDTVPIVSSSMYPCLRLPSSIHKEIAVYTNKPYFKYAVRHTQDLFSYVQFLTSFGNVHNPQEQSQLVFYPLSYVRKVLAVAQSRYFKGGIAVLPNMDYVMTNLTTAGAILSQVHTKLHFPDNPSFTFNLDDTFFKLENTIIEKNMEMDQSEKIAVRIVNKQNVLRHSIVKFQISFASFCLQDSNEKLLNFQVYVDFEGIVWMYAEVTVEPLSFITLYLSLCDASPFVTRRVALEKEPMRIGNTKFGFVLQNTGIINSVYVKDIEYPFMSQVGFYYGGTERRKRTGHRVFNSDDKAMKPTDRPNYSRLDNGFYGYFTNKIDVVVEKGPLFSEVTQYYNDHVALITRVFNISDDSVLTHTLQQQVLLTTINITQEMAYYVQTGLKSDNHLTVDEADFSLTTIDTQLRTNIGHNYHAMHSTLQIKEATKTEGIRSITLLSDRLYAGGYHNSDSTLEVLLRRSSLWADVADYPEPSRNIWAKEQGTQLRRELGMITDTKKLAPIHDGHRFFFLMNNNTDRETQNLRMEDEEAPVVDKMNFFLYFDLFEKPKPAHPLLIREQTVDPLFVASTIVKDNKMLEASYSLMRAASLPPSVRVINLFKPFANFNGVVIQLTSLLSVEEDKTTQKINMCNLFYRKKVKLVEEVDITGFVTEEVIKKNPLYWKHSQMESRDDCIVEGIKPGDIRSYRVLWE